MGPGSRKGYSSGEEITNSLTHGIGWGLSVVGLILLIVFSSLTGDPWLIVSCTIFGSGLVLMYSNSTLYHSLRNKKVKDIFKILDHSSIYFLIAATYTPYTLTTLRGPWGWVLFGIVWCGFLVGTLFKVFFSDRFKWLSMVVYMVLGWCILIAIGPIVRALPLEGLVLLVAGGISYTVGALVYAKKKVRYSHSVWHVYVLAGSVFHFASIFFYVIPW